MALAEGVADDFLALVEGVADDFLALVEGAADDFLALVEGVADDFLALVERVTVEFLTLGQREDLAEETVVFSGFFSSVTSWVELILSLSCKKRKMSVLSSIQKSIEFSIFE